MKGRKGIYDRNVILLNRRYTGERVNLGNK